jgi:hypothetical protein
MREDRRRARAVARIDGFKERTRSSVVNRLRMRRKQDRMG